MNPIINRFINNTFKFKPYLLQFTIISADFRSLLGGYNYSNVTKSIGSNTIKNTRLKQAIYSGL